MRGLCNHLHGRSHFEESISQYYTNYQSQTVSIGGKLGGRLSTDLYLSAALGQKRNSIFPSWFQGSELKREKEIKGKLLIVTNNSLYPEAVEERMSNLKCIDRTVHLSRDWTGSVLPKLWARDYASRRQTRGGLHNIPPSP